MFIDCDTHVDESAETWSYIPKAMSDVRPAEMDFVPEQIPEFFSAEVVPQRAVPRGLLVDGHLFFRRNRNDEMTQTTADMRELRDIPNRLKKMDELNVSTQVLYPSLLLEEVTDRPEVEIAICESYNRWIADCSSESNGRMRWNALLPLLSMPDALKEMRRAKEAGAVGIVKRGYESGQRRAGSEYFYPMYELAQELELPICIHSGHPFGAGSLERLAVTKSRIRADFWVMDAFLSLMLTRTYEKFPRLRFGFIEASSSWLPYALYTSQRADSHRLSASVMNARSTPLEDGAIHPRYAALMQEARMFVSCEADEDLPVIISQVGDDNLCVGTDFGHSDRSAILYGHQEILDRDDVSAQSAKKLTETNGARLYGLS